MIYIDFNKTDNYYEFIDESGGKTIIPSSSVILVDDESGYIAVKLTASRKTIGLLKNTTPPTPTGFTGKWLATYTGGTTSSAECDSTSAITDGEITKNNLAEVEIGNCVSSIGKNVFTWCSSLTSVTIPDSVTTIGNSAFGGCSGLTSVIIPDSVTSIGQSAFAYCSGLTSVIIPDSVTSIGQSAFNSCSSLTSVIIPDSVTSIEAGVFSWCDSLTIINIPSGVTSIGANAFAYCSSLTSVTIPDSVTSIGYEAFRNCYSLSSCTIGSGVTSIDYQAFFACTGLTSITIYAVTPPTLVSDALGSTNNCPIYVPSASVDAYKEAEGWSDYADRIQAIP